MHITELIKSVPHQYIETKHYAIFLPHKDKTLQNIIVIGECDVSRTYFGSPSIHAEHDALMKLLKYKNRPNVLDLIVVRYSKTGKLGASRPCYNCIKKLEYCVKKYNINIHSIYYSTQEGYIIKEQLKNMLESETTYISGGFRKYAFKIINN